MVIVLGSGGHTAEMMSLLRDINPKRWAHRTYIVSSGDTFSAGKAHDIEATIQTKYIDATEPSPEGISHPVTGKWQVTTVPRARKIHQPLYTTPISCLSCLIGSLIALSETAKASVVAPLEYPDLIVTNGPATAVIVILASLILKFFGLAPRRKMKVIYVESWARVKTLSLSGKVLLRLGVCDEFLVQWEVLEREINRGGRTKVRWNGFLVDTGSHAV
jgi:beta-1,4-N-acetylglucosaminyltransferase